VGLGSGQPVGPVQDRPQEPVQGDERQLDLGLVPGPAEHPEPGSLVGRIQEQGRLADAKLAMHHQHSAVSLAGVGEQAGDAARSLDRPYNTGHIPEGRSARSR
jgi:hypothetical protein